IHAPTRESGLRRDGGPREVTTLRRARFAVRFAIGHSLRIFALFGVSKKAGMFTSFGASRGRSVGLLSRHPWGRLSSFEVAPQHRLCAQQTFRSASRRL